MSATLHYVSNSGVTMDDHMMAAALINSLCKWSHSKDKLHNALDNIRAINVFRPTFGNTQFRKIVSPQGITIVRALPTDTNILRKWNRFMQTVLHGSSKNRRLFDSIKIIPLSRMNGMEKMHDIELTRRERGYYKKALNETERQAMKLLISMAWVPINRASSVLVINYGSQPGGPAAFAEAMANRIGIRHVVVTNKTVSKAMHMFPRHKRSMPYIERLTYEAARQLDVVWWMASRTRNVKNDYASYYRNKAALKLGNEDMFKEIGLVLAEYLITRKNKIIPQSLRFTKTAMTVYGATEGYKKLKIIGCITDVSFYALATRGAVTAIASTMDMPVFVTSVQAKTYGGRFIRENLCIVI